MRKPVFYDCLWGGSQEVPNVHKRHGQPLRYGSHSAGDGSRERCRETGTKALSETIRKVCRTSKGVVVIDVSAIQFLDSHGLGVLVFHNSVMERAGRRMVFFNTNRNQTSYMNRLFDCTNLFRIFTVIYDLENLKKEELA